jgi:hypothetical protein
MSEATIAAIELDAVAVTNAPLLGYEPGVLLAPAGDPHAVARPIQVPRTWIATENTPATIDIESFADNSPFDELLGAQPLDSTPLPSLSRALADASQRPRRSKRCSSHTNTSRCSSGPTAWRSASPTHWLSPSN